MVKVIIDPGLGMGYAKNIEEGSLFYLFIRIDICLQTWEDPLPHCREELGIIHGGVEYDIRREYQRPFPRAIIEKIRFNAKCNNLRDTAEPAPQCYILLTVSTHLHIQAEVRLILNIYSLTKHILTGME